MLTKSGLAVAALALAFGVGFAVGREAPASAQGRNRVFEIRTYVTESKAGLDALSEALMQEVRHDDIRVAYVRPGSVETDFGGPGRASAAAWKLAAEDVARVVVDLVSHPSRSLPSCVEIRPSRPPRKS